MSIQEIESIESALVEIEDHLISLREAPTPEGIAQLIELTRDLGKIVDNSSSLYLKFSFYARDLATQAKIASTTLRRRGLGEHTQAALTTVLSRLPMIRELLASAKTEN